jgi:hypothetical protein
VRPRVFFGPIGLAALFAVLIFYLLKDREEAQPLYAFMVLSLILRYAQMLWIAVGGQAASFA